MDAAPAGGRSMNTWSSVARFACSGALATVAMTTFMELAFRWLPRREQYPLPPRLITDRVRHRVGLRGLSAPVPAVLALLAHVGFGSVAAVPLAAYPAGSALAASGGGVLHGVAVWTAAYLGVLPASGLLAPVTQHPRGRTALMLTAHIVWGAASALIARAIRTERRG